MNKYAMIVLAGILLGGCASYTATSGRVVIKDDTTVAGARIDARDRALIRDYYGSEKGRLPKPGGNLPPRLAIRDKLPPSLQGEPLPYELERRLAKLPSPHARVRVGQDVVLMDRNTRVIFDIIYGVGK
jgi:hypothetical protein